MKPNDSEYYPYYDIEFNFQTDVSIDDAVLAMLGISKPPFYEVTKDMKDAAFRQEDDFDDHQSLFEVLRDLKELADCNYANADHNNPTESDLKLSDIEITHELIKRAFLYRCHIHDELAKGNDSDLRLGRKSTTDHPLITLKSLSEWCNTHYHLDCILPHSRSVSLHDLSFKIDSLEFSHRKGLKAAEVTKLRATLALLVNALADTDPDLTLRGKPNVSKISSAMEKFSASQNNPIRRSESTFRNEINDSLSFDGNKQSEDLSATKSKTLHIVTALVYEKLAETRYPADPRSEKTLSQLSADLSARSTNLAGQETKSVMLRIERAIDIKNNPDKREN